MSRFTECLKFILEREGGYVDRAEDRGGPTNRGITQAVYDEYRVNQGLSRNPVSGISADEIAAIYSSGYWKPCRCDLLPEPLDLVVLDGAVNHGVKQSSKFLQRALGVGDDGFVGPATVEAAHKDADSGMMTTVVADILDQRRDFYDHLVEKNPSQQVFIKGWHNRLTELRLASEQV